MRIPLYKVWFKLVQPLQKIFYRKFFYRISIEFWHQNSVETFSIEIFSIEILKEFSKETFSIENFYRIFFYRKFSIEKFNRKIYTQPRLFQVRWLGTKRCVPILLYNFLMLRFKIMWILPFTSLYFYGFGNVHTLPDFPLPLRWKFGRGFRCCHLADPMENFL